MVEWMYRSTFSWPSALAGGEWSVSRPCRFTPGERAPGTHWIGGWVGPRASLDDVEKRKFLILPWREIRPLGRPAPLASRYTDYAIPARIIIRKKFYFLRLRCLRPVIFYLEVMNLTDDRMKDERTKNLSGWYCDDDLPVESSDCRFIDHVYIVCDIYS
jgi:hypothetical protein